MIKKKVLFINQEITPYVPESEMSVMGRQLPQKMQDNGFEIRTFMPKWGAINERRGQLHEVIRLSGMNLIIDDTDHPLIIKVASIPVSRLQVYFIDNEDYFLHRPAMTEDENGMEYADNGERAIFFARGVLETVKKLRWAPDLIQCQGWMTAVVPLYIKTAYHDDPSFANTKVVTSLFDNQLKTQLGDNFKRCVEFRDAKADRPTPRSSTSWNWARWPSTIATAWLKLERTSTPTCWLTPKVRKCQYSTILARTSRPPTRTSTTRSSTSKAPAITAYNPTATIRGTHRDKT